MAKRNKKSKLAPLAGGIAAFAVIGALGLSKEPQEAAQPVPPAIVEESIEEPLLPEKNEEASAPFETPASEKSIQPIQSRQPIENTSESTPDPVLTPNSASTEKSVEIDPEKAFREKLMQYNYVGSSESDRYHYPRCRWTDKINDSNLVYFDTEDEAIAAGYISCGTCNP